MSTKGDGERGRSPEDDDVESVLRELRALAAVVQAQHDEIRHVRTMMWYLLLMVGSFGIAGLA